jgi:hypothetical protein
VPEPCPPRLSAKYSQPRRQRFAGPSYRDPSHKIGGIKRIQRSFWSASFEFGVVALTFFFGLRLFSWAAGIVGVFWLLFVDHTEVII